VKGNRQGVLSRSITRPAAELQNHAAKFDFAILKAAWRKCPKGHFNKLILNLP
jgi:hypothetical protein